LVVALAATVAILGVAIGKDQPQSDEVSMVILSHGTSESGAIWELRYRVTERGDCLELFVNEAEANVACGFDIPNTTEVGLGGGLKPGQGDFFLFGFTSSRVATIVAESPGNESEVQTEALPLPDARRPALRFFVLVREPVDDVDALVALDEDGTLVQRLELPRAQG